MPWAFNKSRQNLARLVGRTLSAAKNRYQRAAGEEIFTKNRYQRAAGEEKCEPSPPKRPIGWNLGGLEGGVWRALAGFLRLGGQNLRRSFLMRRFLNPFPTTENGAFCVCRDGGASEARVTVSVCAMYAPNRLLELSSMTTATVHK